MIKNKFSSMVLCFVVLFFAQSFSIEKEQEKESSTFIQQSAQQKNGMNTQEAVASVLKTGIVCATTGGVIYHIVNKFDRQPELWGPVLLVATASGLFVGTIGCALWEIHKTFIRACEKNEHNQSTS